MLHGADLDTPGPRDAILAFAPQVLLEGLVAAEGLAARGAGQDSGAGRRVLDDLK